MIHSKRILIVDDEPKTREGLKKNTGHMVGGAV